MPTAYLMAYFRSERDADGEQIRLAVSEPDDPRRWTPLRGGAPFLFSDVGDHGVRDPFLVRDTAGGRIVIIATDLRVHPSLDWTRTTRTGSRSLVIWETRDLTTWSGPNLVEVSGAEAGNTWAPKAFWSEPRGCWLVIWASALYSADDDRVAGTYQRLIAAPTADFRTFGPPEVYLDLGYDVIDATFLRDGEHWYRFSANSQGRRSPDVGRHIFMERGTALEDPDFQPVAIDVGKGDIDHGEGPAAFWTPDGRPYLLIDEFGHRGYHLFTTGDLASGEWTLVEDVRLPPGARHGSVIPISLEERARLLDGDPGR